MLLMLRSMLVPVRMYKAELHTLNPRSVVRVISPRRGYRVASSLVFTIMVLAVTRLMFMLVIARLAKIRLQSCAQTHLHLRQYI